MATIEKRTNSKGVTSYRSRVRIKGYKTETRTFTSKTKAKLWAHKIEVSMRDGDHFCNAEAKKRTVSEMIDRYLDQIAQQNPKRWDSVRLLLKWWHNEIGHMYLSDVTKPKIIDARDKLCATPKKDGGLRSHSTINRYTQAFRHILNIATNEWEWVKKNPMNGLSNLNEPEGRDRYLRDDERFALLRECKNSRSQNLYPLVMLGLTTGARAGELCNIK